MQRPRVRTSPSAAVLVDTSIRNTQCFESRVDALRELCEQVVAFGMGGGGYERRCAGAAATSNRRAAPSIVHRVGIEVLNAARGIRDGLSPVHLCARADEQTAVDERLEQSKRAVAKVVVEYPRDRSIEIAH